MSFIELRNLSVRYSDEADWVLKDISLTIKAHERVLILGPSGSGKSTLLLTLMGLIPRSLEAEVIGDALLEGRPVSSLTPQEISRSLGFMFQEPENQFCLLYPDEEIAFGLENQGRPEEEMAGEIMVALQKVGLAMSGRSRRIDELSGGQQQRLALAACLALGSRMLLLDEPTSNLDPAGRQSLVESVSMVTEAGRGLLVVEHNLEPWFPLLDRVILLGPDGRLLADGPPAQIFAQWGKELSKLGVWQPRAVEIALAMSELGHPLPKMPLTIAELKQLQLTADELLPAIDIVLPPKQQLPAPPQQVAAVEFRNVSAGYKRGADILQGINLRIQPGEFWAILGPNGSGKSTLTRLLINMVKASTGKVSVFGQNVAKLKPRELFAQVGYIFQNPEHQFVTDTVWQELAHSLQSLALEPGERKQRMQTALEFFGLSHLAASNPFSLSGGQKRRLSVAAMLLGGQPLLVLDEPTFGQDRGNCQHLLERIAELNSRGVTVLMVTHDLDLVESYASHVALLNDGQLRYDGSLAELWPNEKLLADCRLELPSRQRLYGSFKGGELDVKQAESLIQTAG